MMRFDDAAQPFAGGRERALVTWRGADGRELSEEFDEVVLAARPSASGSSSDWACSSAAAPSATS